MLFTSLERIKHLVIPLERADGFQGDQVQEPTENEDAYGESDFPCQRGLGTPPDERQRQGAHAGEGDDDKRGAKIPGNLLSCRERAFGGIQKFTAVLALDGGVLNLFSAEGTFFHPELSWLSE